MTDHELVDGEEWDYGEVHDACCGGSCTVDGCHETHPSGIFEIYGPDWTADYTGVVASEAEARLLSRAPKLAALLRRIAGDLPWSCEPLRKEIVEVLADLPAAGGLGAKARP